MMEIQNTKPELIFAKDLDQRLKALISILKETPENERIFTWEMEPATRKK
jgi:hypothetical protein